MAEAASSLGSNPKSVPADATSRSPHSSKDEQLKDFKKNESASERVEEQRLLCKETYPVPVENHPVSATEEELKFTFENIMDVLSRAKFSTAYWRELGKKLKPGLDMDAFEVDYPTTQRRLDEVVQRWLRDGNSPSWKALAKAIELCNGGGRNVAQAIRRMTGQPELAYSDDTFRQETKDDTRPPVSPPVDVRYSLNSSPPGTAATQQAPQPPNAVPTLINISTTMNTIRLEIETLPPKYSVTNYRVKYKKKAGGNEDQRDFQSRLGESTTSYTICNLQPDTPYVLRIAAVYDGGEGPFSESHSCHTKQKGTKVLVFCFLAIVTVLLLLSLLLFFSIYADTHATGKVLYKNGSVLVGNNGFHTFFQNVFFVKTSAPSTDELSFFRHSCNDLPTTNSTVIQVTRRDQLVDTETNIPLYNEYLVDGSTVCFYANITGQRNLTDCAAAIYILDDWYTYASAFIDGNNVTSYISKYCLNVSSTDQPNLPQCFRVPHPNFFFFGAYIPGKDQGLGVELAVIQTVANKVLYNTSTLKWICKIPSGEKTQTCIIEQKESTSIWRKMCVLMTAEEESAHVQTLSYSVMPSILYDFPHHQNLGTVVSFSALLFAISSVLVILVVKFLCVKCVNRQRRYDPL